MYEFRNYLKTGEHPYDELIEKELFRFREEVLNKLEIQEVITYGIRFFVKNFNREKFIPIKGLENIQYSKVNLSLKGFERFPDKFEEFKRDAYVLSRSAFEECLHKIEKYLKVRREQKDSYLYFRRAISEVFQCNYIKGNILATFLRQHFSFERNVFREYNFEMFTEKEFLPMPINYQKRYKIYNLERISLKGTKKEKIIRKCLYEELRKLVEAYESSNQGIFLLNILNFVNSKSIREKCVQSLMIGNAFKRKGLFIPQEYKTNSAYALHYKTILFYFSKRTYNPYPKNLKREHPIDFFLKIYNEPKFKIERFSIEELEIIQAATVRIFAPRQTTRNFLRFGRSCDKRYFLRLCEAIMKLKEFSSFLLDSLLVKVEEKHWDKAFGILVNLTAQREVASFDLQLYLKSECSSVDEYLLKIYEPVKGLSDNIASMCRREIFNFRHSGNMAINKTGTFKEEFVLTRYYRYLSSVDYSSFKYRLLVLWLFYNSLKDRGHINNILNNIPTTVEDMKRGIRKLTPKRELRVS